MQVTSRLWRPDKGKIRRAGARIRLALFCCLVGSLLIAYHAAALPPTAPAVLVDGPINLTWAANHSAYWRERGVDGFLVYGLAAAVALPEEAAVDGESPLLREIRVAQQRLRVAGLGRNFFHWDIQDAWDATENPRDALRRQAAQAATFSRAAGLQGVAIRLPRDSAALAANAKPATHTPAVLEARTQQLHETGLRIIRELLGAHPHGEIMLLAEAPLDAGRDWWALLGGMLAGPDAAPISLHFIDISSRDFKRALDYEERRESLHRHGRLALSDSGFALWRRHSAPAFCVSLFEAAEKGVAASHTLEASRFLGLAAATFSDHYTLIQSAPGGLWEVTDERAEAYAALEQQIPVEATPPLLPLAHQINLNTPLTRLKRIGPYQDDDGAPVFVFQGPGGAAVLFWGGLAAPTRLPSRAAMVELWNPLQSRTRSLVPEDGYIVIPPHNDPVLVRGLPVGDWSLPAALRLQSERPFREQEKTNILAIHITNPLPVALDASLSLWAPEGIGAGRQTITLNLAPGASHRVDREIRGQWTAGEQLAFRLVLTRPGSGILTRSFDVPVSPPLLWRQHLQAEVSAAPGMLQAEDTEPLTVVTSGSRYVTAFGADGALAWEYDHGSSASVRLLPVIGAMGQHLALRSENAAIVLISSQGEATTVPASRGEGIGQPIALWNHGPLADPYLLALRDGNTLIALKADGTRAWERSWQEGPALLPPQYPLIEQDLPAPPLILFFPDAVKPFLEALDQSGETLWTFQAPEGFIGDALLFYGVDGWQIALWNRVSQIWSLEATTGRSTERRVSVAPAVPGSYEIRPIPAEQQVRLMFRSRGNNDVLELDHHLRKATKNSLLPADHIRAFHRKGETVFWGVRGTRPVGIAPQWHDPPLSAAPNSLMVRLPSATREVLLYIIGSTEMRVLKP